MIRKALALACLVAGTGCASGHAEKWTLPEETERAETIRPGVQVVFDRFDGFATDSQVEKARRAVIAIQAVLNSAEFRCRVLSFDGSVAINAAYPGVGCQSDPARRDLKGDKTGFYWGVRPGGADAVKDYGNPIPNKSVYARILTADEPQHPGEPPRVVHITTGLRGWHPLSIGSTWQGVTETNSGWFERASLPELAGHWLHEYMHVLGFTHETGRSPGRSGSVPYAVGLFGCQISRAFLDESYDSSGTDDCVAKMQGL